MFKFSFTLLLAGTFFSSFSFASASSSSECTRDLPVNASSVASSDDDASPEAFMKALRSKDEEALLKIVENGLNEEHARALGRAVCHFEVDIIKFLTEHVKDPSFYNLEVPTTLAYKSITNESFSSHSGEVLRLLLEARANPDYSWDADSLLSDCVRVGALRDESLRENSFTD